MKDKAIKHLAQEIFQAFRTNSLGRRLLDPIRRFVILIETHDHLGIRRTKVWPNIVEARRFDDELQENFINELYQLLETEKLHPQKVHQFAIYLCGHYESTTILEQENPRLAKNRPELPRSWSLTFQQMLTKVI